MSLALTDAASLAVVNATSLARAALEAVRATLTTDELSSGTSTISSVEAEETMEATMTLPNTTTNTSLLVAAALDAACPDAAMAACTVTLFTPTASGRRLSSLKAGMASNDPTRLAGDQSEVGSARRKLVTMNTAVLTLIRTTFDASTIGGAPIGSLVSSALQAVPAAGVTVTSTALTALRVAVRVTQLAIAATTPIAASSAITNSVASQLSISMYNLALSVTTSYPPPPPLPPPLPPPSPPHPPFAIPMPPSPPRTIPSSPPGPSSPSTSNSIKAGILVAIIACGVVLVVACVAAGVLLQLQKQKSRPRIGIGTFVSGNSRIDIALDDPIASPTSVSGLDVGNGVGQSTVTTPQASPSLGRPDQQAFSQLEPGQNHSMAWGSPARIRTPAPDEDSASAPDTTTPVEAFTPLAPGSMEEDEEDVGQAGARGPDSAAPPRLSRHGVIDGSSGDALQGVSDRLRQFFTNVVSPKAPQTPDAPGSERQPSQCQSTGIGESSSPPGFVLPPSI